MSTLKKAYSKFLGGITSPFGIKQNTTAKDYGLGDSMAANQKRRGGPAPTVISAPVRTKPSRGGGK